MEYGIAGREYGSGGRIRLLDRKIWFSQL